MAFDILDQETFEAVKLHIETLADDKYYERMSEKSYKFIRDMAARLDKYDRDVSLTPAQVKYVGDLYNQLVNKEKDEDEIEATDTRFNRWSNR